MQKLRIAYLVPRFPGQTHAFFWREVRALEQDGVAVQLISTLRPPRAQRCHSWAPAAMERTLYLIPPRPRGVWLALQTLLRAGPRGWRRCFRAALEADGLGPVQRWQLLPLVLAGAELAGWARQMGLTHLHVHSCANSAFVALFAERLAGLCYSLTLHGPLEDYGPGQSLKWRHALLAIVITERLRSQVESTLGPTLGDKILVAPMGVDVEEWRRSAPYAPWRGGPVRLLTCGRLNPVKGFDVLLRAVALLREQGIDAHLEIAGADDPNAEPWSPALERLVDQLALRDGVALLGAVPEKTLRAAHERAHLFVLPSRHEPLGVALMEAMAMGGPVLATRAGGVPELIHDGQTGFLVERNDPVAMAHRIREILDDPERALRVAEAGRQRVLHSFHSGVSARVLVAGIERQLPAGCAP